MAKEKQGQEQRIDQFFSGPGARADHWRFLMDAAKAWADGGNRHRFDALFDQLEVTEEYHGYPGLRLMAASRKLRLPTTRRRRCARHEDLQSLQTRSFRQHAGDWDAHEDGEQLAGDLLPPTLGAATRVGPISKF